MVALSNAELDILFEPRAGTTKIADTNLQTGGIDISNRYMDKSVGLGATAALTNLQDNGLDLNQLFTALGDYLDLLWQGLGAATVNNTFSTGGPVPPARLTLNSDGSVSITGTVTVGSITDWLGEVSASNGSDFECRHLNNTGDPLIGPTAFTNLGTSQSFDVLSNVDGETKTNTFDLEIRKTGGTAESRIITITAVNNIGAGEFTVTILPSNPAIAPGALTYSVLENGGSVTVIQTSATIPTTFIWTRLFGSTNITINNPLNKFPIFSCVNTGNVETATWQLEYTDSTPIVPQTASDTVVLSFDFGAPV